MCCRACLYFFNHRKNEVLFKASKIMSYYGYNYFYDYSLGRGALSA
jgi:hypothetical protein